MSSRPLRTTRFRGEARGPGELLRAAPTRLLSALLALAVYFLGSTWRIRRFTQPVPQPHRSPAPGIYLLHHRYLLVGTLDGKGKKVGTLISWHRDGQLIADVAEWLGLIVIRGSSSRGAVPAFLELTRFARRGLSLAITVDGPRGPRCEIKRGVLGVSGNSDLPVFALSYACDRAVEFPSWDRFLIPLPFATVGYATGTPNAIEATLAGAALDARREILQAELLQQAVQLETLLGVPEDHRSRLLAPGEPRRPRGRGLVVVSPDSSGS